MEFEVYLKQQLQLHPSMQPQDAVKLCYQAALGAEHLLTDFDAAEKYFTEEYAAVTPAALPLFEEISPEVCRVNLAAWKAKGLPAEWLFRMFTASVRVQRGTRELFKEYLATAEKVLPLADWQTYLDAYKAAGMPTVHHSDAYRAAEHPAYRIVDRRFVKLLPILEKIAALPRGDRACVIALEGRAAAGKSTAAESLAAILGAGVVHMDDFFLPFEKRTEERLAEAGGNVDYERFRVEVLDSILAGGDVTYSAFDCSTGTFLPPVTKERKSLTVIEGSYAHHPYFGDAYDLRIALDISDETQQQRILARNGERMLAMFVERWIPMEHRYFEAFSIFENADLIL